MKVLVLGGTRFAGVHLVNELLAQGHEVTIATRGKTADNFGNRVARKIINREDADSMKNAFANQHYDAVVDNLSYSSNDVRNLLDNVNTDRYVMTSSVSVYKEFHLNMFEEEVDTNRLELIWCNRTDFDYAEIKRQSENALFQHYSKTNSVAVRFPWIFGTDDYTKRLFFYAEHVIKGLPMCIDNLDEELSFISSHDAGKFLAWCAANDIQGAVNAASIGTARLRDVISYIENKIDKKAVIQDKAEPAPLNSANSFSLNLDKAISKGYKFQNINDWLYKTLDFWIKELINKI